MNYIQFNFINFFHRALQIWHSYQYLINCAENRYVCLFIHDILIQNYAYVCWNNEESRRLAVYIAIIYCWCSVLAVFLSQIIYVIEQNLPINFIFYAGFHQSLLYCNKLIFPSVCGIFIFSIVSNSVYHQFERTSKKIKGKGSYNCFFNWVVHGRLNLFLTTNLSHPIHICP